MVSNLNPAVVPVPSSLVVSSFRISSDTLQVQYNTRSSSSPLDITINPVSPESITVNLTVAPNDAHRQVIASPPTLPFNSTDSKPLLSSISPLASSEDLSSSDSDNFSPPHAETNHAAQAPSKFRPSIEDRIRALRDAKSSVPKNAQNHQDYNTIDPFLLSTNTSASATTSGSKRPAPNDDIDSSYEDSRRGDLSQLVLSLKARKRHKPHISALLDDWMNCKNDPIARELVVFGAVLDVLDNSVYTEEYKIPAGLKTNLRKYTMAVALSPILTAYRGNIAHSVINAMRELNISNIPNPKDEDQMAVICSEIRSIATEFRNVIKSKIAATLTSKAEPSERHISGLTHTIVTAAGIGFAMTADLQMRIAFLRFVFQEGQSDFWKAVDTKLREWEEEYHNAKLLLDHMGYILKLDQEDFPRPATKIVVHPTVASKDLESWQLVCDRHAGTAGTEKLSRKGKGKAK